jgi:hypothetical protein
MIKMRIIWQPQRWLTLSWRPGPAVATQPHRRAAFCMLTRVVA